MYICLIASHHEDSFPHRSVGKESVCGPEHLGSIPWSGRSPGEGNGNAHQHPCLENPMVGGAWWAEVHAVGKRGTTEQLT